MRVNALYDSLDSKVLSVKISMLALSAEAIVCPTIGFAAWALRKTMEIKKQMKGWGLPSDLIPEAADIEIRFLRSILPCDVWREFARVPLSGITTLEPYSDFIRRNEYTLVADRADKTTKLKFGLQKMSGIPGPRTGFTILLMETAKAALESVNPKTSSLA
ncbi:hypothetical protein ACFL11_00330 [Patescibacteria group bacterium]